LEFEKITREISAGVPQVEAIEKYGIIRGGGKAIWRIMRCNPFNQGGYDPVDKKKE